MIIKKLILYKNSRFSLGNITKLTLTPKNKIIMVVGTNGIGKSSLLFELSPIPADLNDYYEDGYKKIEIEHNKNIFVLTSNKSNSKHSFLLNDEEQNRSGTKKIQLELVYKYFGLTPDIMNVLQNVKMFTNMSVSDRKRWFTNISNIDYNYPISVFDKLKRRDRDIIGGIKLFQTKLAKEKSNILTEDSLNRYKKDLDIYKKLLDNLLSSKSNLNKIEDRDIIKEFNKVNEYGYNLLKEYKPISENIYELQHNLIYIDKEIKECEDRLNKTDILNTKIDKNIIENLKNIKKEISNIESSIYIENIDINNIDKLYNSFILIYPEVTSLISELSVYKDLNIDLNRYNKIKEDIEIIDKNINNVISINNRYETKLDEYNKKKEKSITCPKCKNQFYDGYDETEVKLLKDKLNRNMSQLDSLKDDLNKLLESKKRYEEREEIVNSIFNIIKSEISNIIYYNLIKDNIRVDSDTILNKLYRLKEDFNSWNRLTKLYYDRDKLEKEIEIYNLQKEIENKYISDSREKIEKKLHNLKIDEKVTKDKIEIFNRNISIKNELDRLNKKLKELFKLKNRIIDNKVVKLKNDLINDMVFYIKSEISKIEKVINDYEYTTKNIEVLQKEINEYKEIDKVLKIMIKELSPTDGLIAKSIKSFLNIFMEEMNILINSIWTYELNVLPCKIDNEDLDYRFPVDVEGKIRKDISKTSSSMIEIINLAFRIVSMKFLGLENYPLYLDEFSKTMDPKHRIKTYEAIEKLSENSFNQIFIVSHFESMFARFKSNTDLIVLSEDNMMLDKRLKYNEILKLE